MKMWITPLVGRMFEVTELILFDLKLLEVSLQTIFPLAMGDPMELEEDLFCGFERSGSEGGDVLILINTGDIAVTRQLPDSVAEFQNLCDALYIGEDRALVSGREITVPAGGILFLKKQ